MVKLSITRFSTFFPRVARVLNCSSILTASIGERIPLSHSTRTSGDEGATRVGLTRGSFRHAKRFEALLGCGDLHFLTFGCYQRGPPFS